MSEHDAAMRTIGRMRSAAKLAQQAGDEAVAVAAEFVDMGGTGADGRLDLAMDEFGSNGTSPSFDFNETELGAAAAKLSDLATAWEAARGALLKLIP